MNNCTICGRPANAGYVRYNDAHDRVLEQCIARIHDNHRPPGGQQDFLRVAIRKFKDAKIQRSLGRALTTAEFRNGLR